MKPPNAMTNTTTATFKTTIIVFVRALSRIPKMSRTVTAATMSSAGKLNAMPCPAIIGIVVDE